MGKRQEKMDAMSRFEKCRHRSYDGFRAGATPICHYGAKTLGLSFDETTILGNKAPFYFDASMPDLYTPLCSGAT